MSDERGWKEWVARLAARPEACLGCGVTDSEGRRCYLERDHADRPHMRVTHHVQGPYVPGQPVWESYHGLGWAEWEDDDSLVTFPVRPCPHDAGDRASCRHEECVAWREALREWARGERPRGLVLAAAGSPEEEARP